MATQRVSSGLTLSFLYSRVGPGPRLPVWAAPGLLLLPLWIGLALPSLSSPSLLGQAWPPPSLRFGWAWPTAGSTPTPRRPTLTTKNKGQPLAKRRKGQTNAEKEGPTSGPKRKGQLPYTEKGQHLPKSGKGQPQHKRKEGPTPMVNSYLLFLHPQTQLSLCDCTENWLVVHKAGQLPTKERRANPTMFPFLHELQVGWTAELWDKS